MDALKQDMNKKYVEMHLIMNKYLIEPEQDVGSLGGARANLYNLLRMSDEQPMLGTSDDLNK